MNARERVGGTGEDPRIPFGKGWDLARRPPYDAYGRPRPGAAYLQASPLPPAPLQICWLAFWLARVIVLIPKPAICEFWWGWEAKEGLLPTPVLPLGAGWLGGWLLHVAGILEARGLHF